MGANKEFSIPSVANLLHNLHKEGFQVPAALKQQVEALRKKLQEALLQDYEKLEDTLQLLFPSVWRLRVEALPILAKMDITAALRQLTYEFEFLPQQHPRLAEVAQRLSFGLTLMQNFVEDVENQPIKMTIDSVPASLDEIITQIQHIENAELRFAYNQLLQGSIKIELLLFAVDLATSQDFTLDESMYYELKYQAAVAVKQYAIYFDYDATQMPWYQSPKNALQEILVSGPTFSEPAIQYVREKQDHLNAWR